MKNRLLILLCAWLLPFGAMSQSELYKRYASRQDLTVAQVSGFKLNDTARVDVVLLVADNATAWESLKQELDIRGDSGTVSWLGDTRQPAKRAKWNGKPLLRVVASHSRKTVAFYRLENEGQYDALLDYQLKNIK